MTRPRHRLRTIAVFPAMLTLGNLICGFFAIVVAARVDSPQSIIERPETRAEARDLAREQDLYLETDPRNLLISAVLIFAAMLFDALDGHVARMARSTTDFGGQLDSLCDLVTFGVAPAFLLVKMCPKSTFIDPRMIWIIPAVFAACAALRLARFNVEGEEDDDHMSFVGLPAPAAAASVAGFAIMFHTLRQPDTAIVYADTLDYALQRMLPIYAALLSMLMVSRLPYPHLVNQMLGGRQSFGHLVRLVFVLLVIMVVPTYSVPILCFAFAVGSPVRYAWDAWVMRRPHDEPLF